MGKSRYSGNDIIDGKYYTSWRNLFLEDNIDTDILAGLKTIEHVVVRGQRLDHIASKYYGDATYYYIVALANKIIDPFSLTPGQKLLIPTDLREFLNRIS